MINAPKRPSGLSKHAILRALLLLPLLLPAFASAQSPQSTLGGDQAIRIGAAYSLFRPDFGPKTIQGTGAWVDLQWNSIWSLEGEARFLRFDNYNGETETNYLIGPRYTIVPRGRIRPWAAFLAGVGEIHFPYQIGQGSFFAMAPAAGIDDSLSGRLNLRVSYEYQFWPTAPGIPNEPSQGMHPNGLTAGISWRIF